MFSLYITSTDLMCWAIPVLLPKSVFFPFYCLMITVLVQVRTDRQVFKSFPYLVTDIT